MTSLIPGTHYLITAYEGFSQVMAKATYDFLKKYKDSNEPLPPPVTYDCNNSIPVSIRVMHVNVSKNPTILYINETSKEPINDPSEYTVTYEGEIL